MPIRVGTCPGRGSNAGKACRLSAALVASHTRVCTGSFYLRVIRSILATATVATVDTSPVPAEAPKGPSTAGNVVQTENGNLMTVVQGPDPVFSTGMRVLVLYGSPSRIIADPRNPKATP